MEYIDRNSWETKFPENQGVLPSRVKNRGWDSPYRWISYHGGDAKWIPKYGIFVRSCRILESTYNLQSQFLSYLSQLDVPLIHAHIFGRCHFKSLLTKGQPKILVLGPTTHQSWCWGFDFLLQTALPFRNLVKKPSPPKITETDPTKKTYESKVG